jgi:hypothetical protein
MALSSHRRVSSTKWNDANGSGIMAPMSGLIDAVSKALPYSSVDQATNNIEDRENSIADRISTGYFSEVANKKDRQSTDTTPAIRSFSSDLGLGEQLRGRDSTANSVQYACYSSQPSCSSSSLLPPWPNGQRSSSNSQVVTRSCSKEAFSPDTIIRREATKPDTTGKRPSIPSQYRRESGPDDSRSQIGVAVLETSLKWCSSIRPKSDLDLRTAFKESKRPGLNKPLKTCMRQKARSANTTPPSGSLTGTKDSLENQKLRRMNTVDFEEAISKPVPYQLGASSRASGHRMNRPEKASKQAPSCPGMTELTRRRGAEPAVTRTDVHIIAIAPTSSKYAYLGLPQPKEDEEADPATPTMQIVESSNASYEIVWDDIPPEHNERVRRRRSSASQALEAISSTATRGLERVNTKLTEWSGTRNALSDSFKPTIVVFPNNDGRIPHFECAIVDDEGIEIFAPPNSERVSAVHSRHPSRPVSSPMSRATSQEGINAAASPHETLLDTTSTEQSPVLMDPDAWSAHLVAARRNIGKTSPACKLSNIDEVDVKFRNHRDSVTITHSRLIQSGVVKPELFTQRDAMLVARKRLHTKNRASAPQQVHRRGTRSEPGPILDEETSSIPPLPIVNAHAAEALKNNSPHSILRPPGPVGPQNIQIKE